LKPLFQAGNSPLGRGKVTAIWKEDDDRRSGCAFAQHYADLPASAVESARRDILDTFGCMLGGSGSPGIGELFAVVSRWGGLMAPFAA
jgi:hypothetical protein